MLLEYDKRFAVYKDFIFYDYKNPLAIPRELGSAFDVVLADPPFLADECLTKTAVTVKFMAKNQIILCTGTCQLFNYFLILRSIIFCALGAVMEDMAKRLLNLEKCNFVPGHRNNLANEFRCYTNYDMDSHVIKPE